MSSRQSRRRHVPKLTQPFWVWRAGLYFAPPGALEDALQAVGRTAADLPRLLGHGLKHWQAAAAGEGLKLWDAWFTEIPLQPDRAQGAWATGRIPECLGPVQLGHKGPQNDFSQPPPPGSWDARRADRH
jgi:hypothetical protein